MRAQPGHSSKPVWASETGDAQRPFAGEREAGKTLK